jgi:hypothetical protein
LRRNPCENGSMVETGRSIVVPILIAPAPAYRVAMRLSASVVCPHFADFAGDCHLLPSAI